MEPRPRPRPGRLSILWIGLWTLLAQAVGSVFNVWYNLVHIMPLLSGEQQSRFLRAIHLTNGTVYPVGVLAFLAILLSLQRTFGRLWAALPVDPAELLRSQQRAINLGWWAVGIATPCWLICIPVFLAALPRPLDARVYFHLPVSIGVATLIAQTLTFFAIEILSQRGLYPVLFQDARPSEVPGTYPLSLRGRGLLTSVAASLCPILSLLLLVLAPHPGGQNQLFAVCVAFSSALLALLSVGLVSHLVEQPVRALRWAARRVHEGDLTARVELLRADDFGPLIDEFNRMVGDLSEKRRIEESFGRHVGRDTARQILSRGDLAGQEMEISVVFVDIRGFTTRCSSCTPREAVALLNVFLTAMVEIIERHGGMVNKFLGDGLMALFGAVEGSPDHADRAVASALEQIRRVAAMDGLQIGVGICSGPALVGSIGAPQRAEYTAIGDTVNVASRIESLTKEVGRSLLISQRTYELLSDKSRAVELPARTVKGKAEPVRIYGVEDPE